MKTEAEDGQTKLILSPNNIISLPVLRKALKAITQVQLTASDERLFQALAIQSEKKCFLTSR